VYIDPAGYSNKSLLNQYANGYDTKPTNTNKVLINVFNYSPDWKISVTENGTELAVTQVAVRDPLHTLSYNCQRVAKGATPTSSFTTETVAHMFSVTASSPTSTLTIKVTDSNGTVYTEQMHRPKQFSLTMK
ncbi:MAG: calcineurin-like phosphoesterase C-terminal domain-containing protein, partial [Muribaculaceae bacterium]|nr:calcineurin-like phosphoesterase C-terminal domain-containing protein [Muribaculaceae bacterium]